MDGIKANDIEFDLKKIYRNEFVRSIRETKDTEVTEQEPINQAQEKVIQKLEEVLNILKLIKIKNEENLVFIEKPVDDILTSLKYLPTEPSFDVLPTEIKTDILGYLCNTGAFVSATVCEEWKHILSPTLKKVDTMTIGKHCSNSYQCENNKCFMPQETLKASIALKLNVPLIVCYPLSEVDSGIIAQGLSSVSSLSLNGLCDCNYMEDYECTSNKIIQLFEALEDKDEPMQNLELRMMEDLIAVDQNRLIDFLLEKTIYLTLDEGEWCSSMVDVPSFVEKLKIKEYLLLDLTLHHFVHHSDLAEDMADALCNVYSVNLMKEFCIRTATAKRLIQNILTRPITMKCLSIGRKMDWRWLISSEDLRSLMSKMKAVEFVGKFSQEQVEAVESLPGVEASLEKIIKK